MSTTTTGCRICDGGTTSKVCDECKPNLIWANRRSAAATRRCSGLNHGATCGAPATVATTVRDYTFHRCAKHADPTVPSHVTDARA